MCVVYRRSGMYVKGERVSVNSKMKELYDSKTAGVLISSSVI